MNSDAASSHRGAMRSLLGAFREAPPEVLVMLRDAVSSAQASAYRRQEAAAETGIKRIDLEARAEASEVQATQTWNHALGRWAQTLTPATPVGGQRT